MSVYFDTVYSLDILFIEFEFQVCIISDSDADFMSVFDLDVTFAPDETEKRITIQTNSDVLVEGREQFSVSLSSASERVIVTTPNADIAILEASNGKM